MERESFQRAHGASNSGEDNTIDGYVNKKKRWCRLLTVLCIVSQPGGNNWWEDRAGMHQGSPDMQGWVGEDLISKNRMSTRTLRVWRVSGLALPLYPCIRSSSWVCWLQTQRGGTRERGPGSRAPVLAPHPHHQVHWPAGTHWGLWMRYTIRSIASCHHVIMSSCQHNISN